MFHSCLICTDFTDGLHRLVNCVSSLSSSGLKQIVFFHSVPLWEAGAIPRIDTEEIERSRQRLSVALSGVPQGVEVRVEVSSGQPEDTIPRELRAHPVDVIVMGTPVRALLQERLFGSTSAAIAKATNKPLLILRPQLISTYTMAELNLRCQMLWRYLLVPYNDSPTARYLLTQLVHYAHNRPENSCDRCLLLWVVEDGIRNELIIQQRLQTARERLAEVAEELRKLGLIVETEVRQGDLLPTSLAIAVEYDITAIAIASDSRTNPLEWTVASSALELLHHSWFPLLWFSDKH
ncbi:MAG: universal stress protein [Chloroflexaceae bacterium]|nr:universal stress protein [Chloroflexaceae bacterium]